MCTGLNKNVNEQITRIYLTSVGVEVKTVDLKIVALEKLR